MDGWMYEGIEGGREVGSEEAGMDGGSVRSNGM